MALKLSDEPDAGLTAFGKALVARCEESGVIVDCSHLNERTSLDIMQIAHKPVVFSHSNIRRLEPDLRNITDAMIDACAASGGAIGITGMSKLLPSNRRDVEGMADQIDYVAQRVGVQHVGIGLD